MAGFCHRGISYKTKILDELYTIYKNILSRRRNFEKKMDGLEAVVMKK